MSLTALLCRLRSLLPILCALCFQLCPVLHEAHTPTHPCVHAGIPPGNQALLFAGRTLCPDSALLLDELQLDRFNLAQEAVIYMQPLLSQPVRVYLAQPAGASSTAASATATAPRQVFCEVVEAGSSLANILLLLVQRGLAQPHQQPQQQHRPQQQPPTDSSSMAVVVKRQDGSGCPRVHVHEGCTIQRLQETIWAAEGVAAGTLTFCQQAHDGCLQVAFTAAARDDM